MSQTERSYEDAGYEVLHLIGVGGISEVYAAMQRPSGETSAIKVLRSRGEVHEREIRRFLREGRLLQRLRHQGLPRCLEIFEGSKPALILELLQGEDLHQRLRREGPLSGIEILTLAESMLRILVYLHENGVVHRDLKSSNIFLCDDGRMMITDLGLAVDPHDPFSTTLGDVLGTYSYMAPEQLAGGRVDARTDLYALGVTLFECLTSRRPYKGNEIEDFLLHHVRTPVPELPEEIKLRIPSEITQLISHLMARDPAQRPQSARSALALLTQRSVVQELRPGSWVGRSAVVGAMEGLLDGGQSLHLQGELGSGLRSSAQECVNLGWQRGWEIIQCRGHRLREEGALVKAIQRSLARMGHELDDDPVSVAQTLALQHAETQVLVSVTNVELLPASSLGFLQQLIRTWGLPILTTSLGQEGCAGLSGHRLWLRRLRKQETAELIASMLDSDTPPPQLVEQLHEFSGGLPSLVQALLQDGFRRGLLHWKQLDAEGRPIWKWKSRKILPQGHSLRWWGETLLQQQSDAGQEVLCYLALMGSPMPDPLLRRIAGLDSMDLTLDQLTGKGLLLEPELLDDDPDAVSLSAPAIGQLILSTLSPERCRRGYRRIAEELIQWPSSRWQRERLNLCMALGAKPESRSLELITLAEWKLQQGQYHEASDLLDRTSDLEIREPTLATHRSLARGETLLAQGEVLDAASALGSALALARQQMRVDLQSRALTGMGWLEAQFGSAERALYHSNSAMQASEVLPEGASQAEGLLLRAESSSLLGELQSAREDFNKAYAIAIRNGLTRCVAHSQLGLARLDKLTGRLDQASEGLSQAAKLLGDSSLRIRVICLAELSELLILRGRLSQAMHCTQEAMKLALSRSGRNSWRWAEISRQRVLGTLGDPLNFLKLGGQNATIPHDLSHRLRVFWFRTIMEERLQKRDQPAALSSAQEAYAICEDSGWSTEGAYIAGAIGVLTGHQRDYIDALQALEEMGAHFLSLVLRLRWAQLQQDRDTLWAVVEETHEIGAGLLEVEALHSLGCSDAFAIATQRVALLRQQYDPMFLKKLPHASLRWAIGQAP